VGVSLNPLNKHSGAKLLVNGQKYKFVKENQSIELEISVTAKVLKDPTPYGKYISRNK
jgi:ribosomal protein L28